MIALLLQNLRWRWEEWWRKPLVEYVSLRRLRREDPKGGW